VTLRLATSSWHNTDIPPHFCYTVGTPGGRTLSIVATRALSHYRLPLLNRGSCAGVGRSPRWGDDYGDDDAAAAAAAAAACICRGGHAADEERSRREQIDCVAIGHTSDELDSRVAGRFSSHLVSRPLQSAAAVTRRHQTASLYTAVQ